MALYSNHGPILKMKVSATPTALELIEDLKERLMVKDLCIPSIWWML
jgi:hypothetical protein